VPKKCENIDKEFEISKENKFNDLMDVPFDKILPLSEFPGFKQSKKYVDYTDTNIIAELLEFKYWSNCVDI